MVHDALYGHRDIRGIARLLVISLALMGLGLVCQCIALFCYAMAAMGE